MCYFDQLSLDLKTTLYSSGERVKPKSPVIEGGGCPSAGRIENPFMTVAKKINISIRANESPGHARRPASSSGVYLNMYKLCIDEFFFINV